MKILSDGCLCLCRRRVAALVAIMFCGATVARAQPPAQLIDLDPQTQIPAAPLPCTIKDRFTFAAAGDTLYSLPQTPLKDPEFDKVARILRGADVSFANDEGSIFDMRKFDGYLSAEVGGGGPVADPAVADDLKDMGIKVVSKANNHAMDWGIEGLQATERELDRVGLPHAGSGRNRAAARAPALIDTAKGRVAVVATASTFTEDSVAGLPLGDMPGRPGISVLRTKKIILVTAAEMTGLRAIAARTGGAGEMAALRPSPSTEATILGQTYRIADKPGLTYEMNRFDRFEILQAIRGAKQISDLTVFSIHAHETASGQSEDHAPADFLRTLFHEAVDAGADIIVAHGPHATRGVEIYKGKPIFYGLGSLFFLGSQRGANPAYDEVESTGVDPHSFTRYEYSMRWMSTLPQEWWESIIAISEFEQGKVKEIRLYPLDLRYAEHGVLRGVPQLAAGDLARSILERVRRDSVRFGTDVRIENGIGTIHVVRGRGLD
jgi:poly-gamma-glutamate capsule biosynthesis protein CapA/YwtB (metallophosphatase superfamily)